MEVQDVLDDHGKIFAAAGFSEEDEVTTEVLEQRIEQRALKIAVDADIEALEVPTCEDSSGAELSLNSGTKLLLEECELSGSLLSSDAVVATV